MSEQCPLYPQSGHSAGRSLAVSALTPYTNTQLIIRTISQPKIISMGRSHPWVPARDLRFRPGNQRYISDCCVSSKGQPQWYTDCGDVRFSGGMYEGYVLPEGPCSTRTRGSAATDQTPPRWSQAFS